MNEIETRCIRECFKTECGLADKGCQQAQKGGRKMRRLLALLIAVGLMVGLSACGATLQQSVKASSPTSGGATQADLGEHLDHHAYRSDDWIEDTPFGY